MSTISLPTSCLLDKNVVREALRGLVRATLDMPLPPRQGTSLGVDHALIAHGGLLYITLELWHLLERPANLPIVSPFLSYLRILRPGRYLKQWVRRLTEEGFSHEDAMILSYASFGFDALEKTFGVESVLTNDLRMKDRYVQGLMWLYSSGHTETRDSHSIRGVFDEPTHDEKVSCRI